MASSSTSSIQKIFKYDVFLSFRGDDTRKNFVDHLYYALKHKSIQTYKDDEEINKGKNISDELINSIQDSKFYIIVFSKNYASSSWCLNELVKILECRTRKDQKAYPVFYDVEPREVRNQIGAVGEAFAKHENAEAAGKWRGALKEAADLAGWELKANFNGHEAKFIKKIVEEISLDIRPIWSGTYGKLVGMETRAKNVVTSLKIDYDDVRMIGIKGMGGGGKTTLARAVFDQISASFEGQSFVENVREVSKASLYGLKSLQKQVLSDVSNDQGITVNSVSDGKNMMKSMMLSRRVLVVLDDVDHLDQLEALAGEPNWFKSGSRIIITTRDEQVLVAHRVINLILDVNLLSDEEAICLFSRYAFGREVPIEGYEELSTRVVRYAAGLPLTMRVLGSYLCGKDNLDWVDALERLQTIPLEETLQKLEISYIGLANDYKEIFLDVACFLKGRNKDEAIKVLESQGFYARNGLRVLQQKSLITISEDNELNMHDHIEEMGKNIVRHLHPDEPWRHSRLWIEAEIKDILANDQGTEETRGIQLCTSEFGPETYMRGLRKMKKLRFLYVKYIKDDDDDDDDLVTDDDDDDDGDRSSWKFDKCGQYLPNSLGYLDWDLLPLECLPITFLANNLVTLEMPNSNIVRLWEKGERKALNKLRFLNLSYSKLMTFDFELTPNLEMLNLSGCYNMVEFHNPNGFPKLKSLYLMNNKNLRNLTLGSTPNLKWLSLDGCCDLVELHMPYRYPKLKSIIIRSSKLKTLELGLISDLETLSLEGCDMVELHMPDECPNLKYLTLSNISRLRNRTLGSTPDLESLSLHGCCDWVELLMPDEFPNLKKINLNNNSMLRNITLGERKALNKLRSLDLSFSKLMTFDFELTPNLEKIDISYCDDMVEFHHPNGFPKLKSLNLDCNKNLRNLTLGSTPNLKWLSLDGCCDLVELHMPDECPNLKYLTLNNNSTLRNLTLGSTPDLESLSLSGCCDLVELLMPDEFPNLKKINLNNNSMLRNITLGERKALNKLRSLDLSFSKLMTFDFELTPNLEMLNLSGCYNMVEFHNPNGFPKLKSLYLMNNKNLRNLTLGSTPNLKWLSLDGCCDLVELHMPYRYPKLKSIIIRSSKLKTLELGLISDLETLSLEGCDMVELHMPDECPNLKYLTLNNNSTLRNLTLGSTPDLESLSLHGCCDLVELLMPDEFPNLKKINLNNNSMLRNITLGERKALNKLRSLDLSFSKLMTFDFELTPNLEKIDISYCDDMVEFHHPNGFPKLKSLNLDCNKNLRNLTLGSTPNLKWLSLDGCCDLVELHMPYRYPKLKSIIIRSSKLKTLELGLISDLERLSLEGCDMVELHMPDECPNLKYLTLNNNSTLRNLTLGSTPDLESLSLHGCCDLVELLMPDEFPNLKKINLNNNSMLRNITLGERKALNKLRSLDLSFSKLMTFDFELTPNLEKIDISYCDDMVEFHHPNGFPKLKSLNLDCNKNLRNLTLGSTPNLKWLSLDGCCDLVELHMPYRYPKLKSIIIRSSKLKTLELGLISDLETLSLEGCDMVELHMPDECPNLKYLTLNNNSTLRNLTLGSTPDLESLSLHGCCDLVELLMPDEFPNLKKINLNNNSMLRNITLGERKALNKLRSLDLSFSKLMTFDFELTPNLEKIDISYCDDMVEFHHPNGFPKLKSLNLHCNKNLRNLTLGSTPNLESLSLDGCCDLVELNMPYRYPKLKSIIIRSSKLKTLEPRLISNLEILILNGCDFVELYMPAECPNLKHLKLYNNSTLRNLTLGSTPDLALLSLDGCYDLVELHMPYKYPKLKSIIIRSSKLKTLEPRLISNLETLFLNGCDFVELHMPAECQNLKYLNLNNNSTLRNLTLGSTPDLEFLSLDGCGNLVELHMPDRCTKLESIFLQSSKLKTLELGLISDLGTLSLQGCDIVELHMPDECPNLKFLDLSDNSKLRNLTLGSTPDLKSLSLDGCCDLVELHMPYRYPKLKSIIIRSSKLKTLELGLISDLETISLEGCDLVELHMPDECPNLKYLNVNYNSKLRNLTLGSTPDLESLSLDGCCDLLELHVPYRYPKLKSIILTCLKLKTLELGLISNLERLSLEGCEIGSLSGVYLETESMNICPFHLDNNSSKFQVTRIYKEHPFPMYGNLEKVMSISFCACNLESFTLSVCHLRFIKKLTLGGNIPKAPKDLDRLEGLEELIFSAKEIKNLPDSLCMLKQLKSLHFKSCWLLEKLPEDLGLLECLEELIITDCILLQGIPNSICDMKRLENFHLPYCILVDKLPEELGRLETLKEINIEGTGINYLPDSINRLKGLRVVKTKWRLQSYGFTSVTQTSEYVSVCEI